MTRVWKVKDYHGFDLAACDAEKITETTVVVRGHRRNKVSQDTKFFEDFKEAKAYSVKTLKSKIERAKGDLFRYTEQLKAVEAMNEETVPVATTSY